jgi:hypothetical protein
MVRGRDAVGTLLYRATPPRWSRFRREQNTLNTLGATHDVLGKLLGLC